MARVLHSLITVCIFPAMVAVNLIAFATAMILASIYGGWRRGLFFPETPPERLKKEKTDAEK